jgi:uncharacterized BrkB/YihY/UPF0761 family membrane protein
MDVTRPEKGTEQPERPWAFGGGMVLLGLMTSIIANAVSIQDKENQTTRTITLAVYGLGLLISGAGMYRLLWFAPSSRPMWLRILITAVLTAPVFALLGVILSFLFLMMFYRFG